MAIRCREREYWLSTNTMEYSIQHLEGTCVVPIHVRDVTCSPPGFMMVSLDGARAGPSWLIPCLACSNGGDTEEHYYKHQEKKFTAVLFSRHPGISGEDATEITETFTEILQIANATHTCPEITGLATMHMVKIKIRARSGPHRDPGPELDVVSEEGDVEPSAMPATTASIMGLLKGSRIEGDVRGEIGECLICMEEIKTTSLKMPCSHVFHRDCVIKWLNNSHVCPLCRYQMPPAQFQYSFGG